MKYNVILADPPWFYKQRSCHKDTKFGGGASSNYPLMKDEELLALADQVKAISADNCALALWTVHPRMDFAMELLKAWGFKYSTTLFTWVKVGSKSGAPIYGPGNYTGSNPETVLLGIKGRMQILRKMSPSVILDEEETGEGFSFVGEESVIIEPRGEHSKKPDIVWDQIVEIFGNKPRLEMFCRFPARGWDSLGNQLDGLDISRALDMISKK